MSLRQTLPPRTLDALLRDLRSGAYVPATDAAWADLPTYGGPEPTDTAEIWSWDATRLLVGTCRDDLRLVPRVVPAHEQPGTDGEWLRTTRRNLGLTQVALAESMDVAPNTVARIERDELPLTRATRLAVERLGLAVHSLTV